MAARNAVVTLPVGVWTQITNGAATGDISLELLSGGPIAIQATSAESAPSTNPEEAFSLEIRGDGWSEATIVEKFPGVAGADHLWGRPINPSNGSAKVHVSHA